MNSSESEQLSQTPPAKLSRTGLVIRVTLIGVVIAGIAGLFLFAGGWFTPHALSPALLINTFEQGGGLHPGFRRNHAKGVCVSGYFESNGRGVALSKTVIFRPGRVPVIGRFALAGGQPYVTDAPREVRSMAILFQLPDGEEWRTGMNNIPVFPVRSAQAFRDQLIASALDPATGKPDPAKLKSFLAQYPETAKAMELINHRPISSGFENSTYNSLNAFRFINADGVVTPGRWSMIPVQPFTPIDIADPGKADKNYLFDALISAVHAHPLQW